MDRDLWVIDIKSIKNGRGIKTIGFKKTLISLDLSFYMSGFPYLPFIWLAPAYLLFCVAFRRLSYSYL